MPADPRPLPPDLEFRTPLCPICDQETSYEGDAFWCENCDVAWGRDGTDPEWGNPDDRQCPSTTYNGWSKVTHRCILAAGHKGNHGDGLILDWNYATPTPRDEADDAD